MKKAKGSYLVSQSNDIVNRSYYLSLLEKQVIIYCLSLFNHREAMTEDDMFVISVSDFSRMFGRSRTNSYRLHKLLDETMWERYVPYTTEEGKPGKFRWIDRLEEGHAVVRVRFSEEVREHLGALVEKFTQYHLSDVSKFKSVHSVRLFELFSCHMGLERKTNHVKFCVAVADLRGKLGLEDKYRRFQSFHDKVLKVAIHEITEKSCYRAAFRLVKEKSTVVAIEFHATHKYVDKALENFKLTPAQLEASKDIFRKANKRVDIYRLEKDFYAMLPKLKNPVTNLGETWFGFLRKHLETLK